MPVYNGERYLAEAIESILKQTFSDFELIIVDDASTDGSIDILLKYAKLDNRIRTVANEVNLGIAGATNRGILEADGEYIALMDQDDISLRERFEIEVAFLTEHPGISVVGGNSIKLDDVDYILYKRRKVLESPKLIRWSLLFRNELQNPTVMIRHHVFKELGYKYEAYEPSQDYHLWLKLNNYYWFANLPNFLVIHRLHKTNASAIMSEKHRLTLNHIRRQYILENFKISLPKEIVDGLTKPENIKAIKNALRISDIIIRWERESFTWGLNKDEKNFICKKTSIMINNIWFFQNRHPLMIPYVIYSGLLKTLNHRHSTENLSSL